MKSTLWILSMCLFIVFLPSDFTSMEISNWHEEAVEEFEEELTNHCARCDVTVNNEICCQHFRIKRPIIRVINDSQKANTDEQVHNSMLKLRYVRFLIFIN